MLTASLTVGTITLPADLYAQTSKNKKKTSGTSTSKSSGTRKSSTSTSKKGGAAQKGKTTSKQSKGSGNKGSGNKGNTGNKGNNRAKKQESSQDLKKRQQSVQAEVNATKAEIRKNDASIKKNLNELSKIEQDIAVSQKETNSLGAEVKKLSADITALEGKIKTHTDEVNTLRDEYLKAVKKMRIARKGSSKLAYIFGAKSLSQGARRMRYLKEFSAWKDKQTEEIRKKVELLSKENEALHAAEADKKVMLGRELKAQQKLTEQQKQQTLIVADLRANGEALNSHLERKQAEVICRNSRACL